MSPFLPPEILHLIFDHFPDERTTLGVCSQVSSSWTPSARRHLFFQIDFSPKSFELWIKAFPDPSNTPAHHTRVLSLSGSATVDTAGTNALAWVRAFCNVVYLRIASVQWTPGGVSLVPFHGLFPTLTSFSVDRSYIPSSEILGLICSLPLLKDLDLSLLLPKDTAVTCERNTPLTLPELTGTLRLGGGIRSVACELLNFPNCLRFTKIVLMCIVDEAHLTNDLVLKCCDTLESLSIGYFSTLSMSMFPSAHVVDQYLTSGHRTVPAARMTPPPIDFSKATKLQDLEIKLHAPNVQWIVDTLLTIENLRQISIRSQLVFSDVIVAAVHQEWRDLDRLLVRLWSEHSIRLEISFMSWGVNIGPILFPGLAAEGVFDEDVS